MIVSPLVTISVLGLALGYNVVGAASMQTTNESEATRIYGGTNAFPGEAAYMVSLEIDNLHICGGAILTKHWVLTAGDCVGSPMKTRVVAGVTDLNNLVDHAQVFNINKVIVHPEYDSSKVVNNIAMISIEGAFEFNSFVQPIKIIKSKDYKLNMKRGGMAVLSGWGSNDESVLSRHLKVGTTFIKSPSMCYADSDKGVCNGYDRDMNICTEPLAAYDTGSPLVVNGDIAGIVIRGAKERRTKPCHRYDQYVKISSIEKFIHTSIPEIFKDIFPAKRQSTAMEYEMGMQLMIVIHTKNTKNTGKSDPSGSFGESVLMDMAMDETDSSKSDDASADFIMTNIFDHLHVSNEDSSLTEEEDISVFTMTTHDNTKTTATVTTMDKSTNDTHGWNKLFALHDFLGYYITILFKEIDDESDELTGSDEIGFESDIPYGFYKENSKVLEADPHAEPTKLVVVISDKFRGNRQFTPTNWCDTLIIPNEVSLSVRALLI